MSKTEGAPENVKEAAPASRTKTPHTRVGSETRTEALRRSANDFKSDADAGEANEFVDAAVAAGIDITCFDETAPFGEVCGHTPIRITDNDRNTLGFTFYGVRRVRNDCFGGPDPYFLVSDHMLQAYLMDGKRCPYVTPPRYQAGAVPPSLVRSEDCQPSSYCKRLREGVLDTCSKLIGEWNVSNAGLTMADLSYIDDNAPCGEVCGYQHAIGGMMFMIKDEFYAIRRVRNDCFPSVQDDFLLLSDQGICMNFVNPPFQFDYKTPPRWQPASETVV